MPTTRDPIEAACRTTFHAVHDSGVRDLSDIRWIVLHDEEASTAESAARHFTDPASKGSAHLAVDDAVCYRCLGNDRIAWGAPGANTNGFHIEQAGFAKWSLVLWRSHMGTLRRAAYKTALHCHRFDIPPVFVDAAGLRETRHGVTTHRQVSLAFGGDHSDPGPFWPRRLFMRLVRSYYAELGL
jgi:hypothetical protein